MLKLADLRTPWALLGTLAGASLGVGIVTALAATQPQVDGRWDFHGPSVPVTEAELAGSLRERPDALELQTSQSVSTRELSFREGRVAFRAWLPETSELHIGFGAGQGPSSVQQGGPPQGGRRTSITLDPSLGSLQGVGLQCRGAEQSVPAEAEWELEVQGGVVQVRAGGRSVGECRGPIPEGPVSFGAGLRRVRVDDVRIEARGGGVLEDDFEGALSGGLALGLGGLLGALFGLLGLRSRGLALAAAPLLLAAPLSQLPLRGLLDALRLLSVNEACGGLLFATLPALLASIVVLMGLDLRRAVASLLGLLGALAALLLGLRATAWMPLLAAVPVWAGLAWVNRHPVPRRALISYALLGVLLWVSEVALRWTPAGSTWQRTAGWERAGQEFRELIELREYRSYPSEGFPVRPPEPSARPRIVALGSSSTGGAFQMDDLDLFWPRQLQDRMPGWEVVNQGVGGWNSLHVRLYAESQLEALEPDIVAIYLGHNDLLTRTAMSYAAYYAQYRPGQGMGGGLSDFLHRSRLFNGFKFAVLAAVRRDQAVAVPVDDARDNLRAVVELARAQEARVLLITEGLNPDPGPMEPYAEMQRELAEETGQLYLDAATLLHGRSGEQLFLDDCHLSATGHEVLAEAIADLLQDQGYGRTSQPEPVQR